MDFVAFDFETANNAPTSACSLGICVVEAGKITERRQWFFSPVPHEVGWMQRKIHGLTLSFLKDYPTFGESWAEIEPYFSNRQLLAHNAQFEGSLMRQLSRHFGFPLPTYRLACTVRAARALWPREPSYSLGPLASARGVQFRHHDASDDAYACAELALLLAQETGFVGWSRYGHQSAVLPQQARPLPPGSDIRSIVEGREVVFTGVFEQFSRRDAFRVVQEAGGYPAKSVSRFTRVLVIGSPEFAVEAVKSGKQLKAEEMVRQGFAIRFLSEADFAALIGD